MCGIIEKKIGGVRVFVSIFFLLLLGGTVLAFFWLPVNWRSGILLTASYIFCAYMEPRALVILFGVTLFTYFVAIYIERVRGNRAKAGRAAMLSVCGLVTLLCLFKYTGYLTGRLGVADRFPPVVLKSFLMPVGFSFYLFQVIGYLVDVFKGKSPAEKNFWHLGCWLAFFPKLVSGPIEREGQFFPQMKKLSVIKFWNRGRLSAAFTYMLWGYFMKMVVADRIGPVVGPLFERPGGFDSFWLLLGAFLYSVQIYCDFAGYSYIAVGCAKLFGIEIMENFRSPYMAVDIQDFWRRWHVSLSEWLRDYVYIPLGGNRKGVVRKNLNTMIVFIVCGMWHGVELNFLAWGVLHGVYSVADSLIKEWNKKGMAEKTPDQRKGTGCKRVITFSLTAFAWIFFRAGSLRSALLYVRHMVTAGFWPKRWAETAQSLQLNTVEISIIGVGMLGVWLVDRLCVREKMNLPMIIQQKTNGTRYFVFYLLLLSIFIFGVYGAGYHTEQFIYMQF